MSVRRHDDSKAEIVDPLARIDLHVVRGPKVVIDPGTIHHEREKTSFAASDGGTFAGFNLFRVMLRFQFLETIDRSLPCFDSVTREPRYPDLQEPRGKVFKSTRLVIRMSGTLPGADRKNKRGVPQQSAKVAIIS
jgi:hypothetical protein